jgi:hypothetical protein
VALVLGICQQASQLADKDVGCIRLGKAIHIWKGLKPNLRLEGSHTQQKNLASKAYIFMIRGIGKQILFHINFEF